MANDPSDSPDFEKIFAEATARGDMPDFPEANSFEEMAIGQHVFYKCWMKAGFNSAQALWLVAVGLSGNPGQPPDGDDEDEE